MSTFDYFFILLMLVCLTVLSCESRGNLERLHDHQHKIIKLLGGDPYEAH